MNQVKVAHFLLENGSNVLERANVSIIRTSEYESRYTSNISYKWVLLAIYTVA